MGPRVYTPWLLMYYCIEQRQYIVLILYVRCIFDDAGLHRQCVEMTIPLSLSANPFPLRRIL